MEKVLFVCTENTCRSPIAEGLFRKIASEKEISLEVISAGVFANAGHKASKEALHVSLEKGIDLSKHSTKLISQEIVEDADIVLTMTTKHKELLISIFPELKDKIFTLKEYNGKKVTDHNITNPMGGDLEGYRKCANEIECELELFAEILHSKK